MMQARTERVRVEPVKGAAVSRASAHDLLASVDEVPWGEFSSASPWPHADPAWYRVVSRADLARYCGGDARAVFVRSGEGALRAVVPATLATLPSTGSGANPEALLFRQWRLTRTIGRGGGLLAAAIDRGLLPVLRAAGVRLHRALVLITPLAYETCPWFDADAGDEERREAFDALLGTVQRHAREEDLAVAALSPDDTSARPLGLDAAFARRGFLRFRLLEEHRLDLGEGPFDRAYLSGLSSRTRGMVRRERRRAVGAVEAVRLADLPPRDRDRLVDLYRATCAHYGEGWQDMDRDFLDLLAHEGPDLAWVSLARDRARRIVTFALNLWNGSHFCGYHSGQDREDGAGSGLWFETVLYRGIEEACRRGVRSVSWSFMQGVVKRRRGARQIARHAWIWHPRARLVRPLLSAYMSLFSMGAEAFYRRDSHPGGEA